MNNVVIAKTFQDIADLLEIKEDSSFKVRAYQRAARSIKHLPVELEQLMQEGMLREVPGIGEAISKNIVELLTTGRLEYYDKLRAEFPEGISNLMQVSGIGPKLAVKLTKELGIKSTGELEAAIVEGKVSQLSGLGDRAAENILRHIQSIRTKEDRIPLGVALPVAEEIIASLYHCSSLQRAFPVGSVRRFKETVGDVSIISTGYEAEGILDAFVRLPQVREIQDRGNTTARVIVQQAIPVDFHVVEPETFGSQLQYFTGSELHNKKLRERAYRCGLKLSENGIADLSSGSLEKFSSEEEIYSRLGLQFIPPELREGQLEVENAEQGNLPQLVELSGIRGDLHVHTNWSDGQESIETMAAAAWALGYEYLAITDHSRGRGIAHGLNEERLREQILEIKRLNERGIRPRLLTGIEVDIRADGSLDLPDEILSELDIVIAAVHSAMGQDEENMTRRIICALENPNVDILAHPSCRLLGEREPVAADWDVILHAAARSGTMLEINAMPVRLDLKDLHVFRARQLGVKLSIGSDAHSTEHLNYMRFGVGVARRGWCEAPHILNTSSLEQVKLLLEHKGSTWRN